jgi:hypothetical protein
MDQTLKSFNFIPALLIALFLFFIVSCNQNDEQRQFEREAISLPQNITETNENGKIVEGREDPDDWRIGPYFQGIVYVDPLPFPNPLLTNQRLNLNIFVTGVDGVSGLRVLVLYAESSARPLYESNTSPLPTGLTSISLAAGDIARFDENPQGLYRIIVQDRQGVIITYGDVRIE